jgi:hypothetical protein
MKAKLANIINHTTGADQEVDHKAKAQIDQTGRHFNRSQGESRGNTIVSPYGVGKVELPLQSIS